MIYRSHLKACVLLALILIARSSAAADTLQANSPRMKVAVKIPLRTVSFDLHDVQLLDGPFKHAQELDRQYLLSLDPDRLLHSFRVNAGLPSSARPLGGWEAPDSEVRGHFVGHYLSACAHMVAATGDPTLRHNADYVVAELAKCQQALGSGYLSAFPDSFIDRVAALKPVWAPWYTIHKICAGLIDMYTLCDNRQALNVVTRLADWTKQRTDRLSDAQMQAMLGNEHGGMNEALANLYAITGNKPYLALAARFNHHAVLDPLAHREDRLTGLHANTQIPKIIGAARQYELTGDPQMYTIADTFWNVVTKERSYVIGGDSDGEHFSPKEHLSQYLSPNTTETCNTYNMLKLTQHLFEWHPSAAYMDYYERALYNHILASQNPETGMMCYYVPLHSGSHKEFNTPTDSFWCCTGTGVENHAHYGEMIYAHDSGSNLFVNLFIASQLNWKQPGVSLRQETRFPEEAGSRLTFTCARPTRLDLHIRHPFWCEAGFRIRINGKEIDSKGISGKEAGTESQPGSYAVLSRVWKSGDTVEIALPMTLRTEGFRDNPHRLAFLYGPIVLCAPTDAHNDVPALVVPDNRVLTSVAPITDRPLAFTGKASAFRVAGRGRGQAVQFTPFYQMADKNYVVYWDVFDTDQWQTKEEAYRNEQARLRDLEARQVDVVRPGEEQNERDHKQAGATTYTGDFAERKWRDAREGGWFSYDLKVLPNAPQDLVCTYWGSDNGRRTFDVLIDGVKLATQTLDATQPGKFIDRVYSIPQDMVRDKDHVTVRFQAHPGMMAGGVFGCAVVKRK